MIAPDVVCGSEVLIAHPELVNLYGCVIGGRTSIGPFVEIQRGAVIGADCKISSHTFICEGVTLEDRVFVGHGVMFTNDRYPRATNEDGSRKRDGDWTMGRTLVKAGASIGSNVTICDGVTIGTGAMVGAGAVVVSDVADHTLVVGVPAEPVGDVRDRERRFRSASAGHGGPSANGSEAAS